MPEPLDIALTLADADQTSALAGALAPLLAGGDTLLLRGGVGAGKTHLARALIQARLARAGRLEEVPSPSFTLVQSYDDGTAEIWHADLYRLRDPAELFELGLDEAFGRAICLVEWPEILGPLEPAGALRLSLAMTEAPGARRLRLASDDAQRWRARLGHALQAAGLAGGGDG